MRAGQYLNTELTKSITPNSVTIDSSNLNGSVEITDSYAATPTPSGKIYITKNDAISMKELENAHIVVTMADGTPVDEWDTTTTAHELSVVTGDYIMTQQQARRQQIQMLRLMVRILASLHYLISHLRVALS